MRLREVVPARIERYLRGGSAAAAAAGMAGIGRVLWCWRCTTGSGEPWPGRPGAAAVVGNEPGAPEAWGESAAVRQEKGRMERMTTEQANV